MKKILLAVLVGVALTALTTFLKPKKEAPKPSQEPVQTEASPVDDDVTLSPKVAPAIAQTTPKPEVKSLEDQNLRKIQMLSQIVLSPEKKAKALEPLLDSPVLMAQIHLALNDPKSYSGDAFKHKLRLLDALYEGLQFPNASLQKRYEQLTSEIMNEAAPEGSSPEVRRRFRADRVEIAMAILKRTPSEASRMNQSESANEAFKQASQLQSLYEVAL